MINRFGKVDEGTTVTDFDEEEIARKHTLSASLAYAEWNRQKINLIDTPGVGNFLADALAALNVADAALVEVDAVSGVMVQTREGMGRGRRKRAAAPESSSTGSTASARASKRSARLPPRVSAGRSVIPIPAPDRRREGLPRGRGNLVSKEKRSSSARRRRVHRRHGARRQ